MTNSRIRFETWEKEGVRLFGESRKEWRFECPICRGTQSGKDFEECTNLSEEKIRNVFFFSCIGRWAKDKRGCDYSSGGLFKLSPVQIYQKGRWIPSFAFAGAPLLPSDDIQEYKGLDGLVAATGDAEEIAWPEWVPEAIRVDIKGFWGCFGRKPKDYFDNYKQNDAPDFGLEEEFHTRDDKWVRGRYVHAWNNIGRVVLPDGKIEYTSI